MPNQLAPPNAEKRIIGRKSVSAHLLNVMLRSVFKGGSFLKYTARKHFILIFVLSFFILLFFTPSISAVNVLKVGVLKDDAPLSSAYSNNQAHGANVAVAAQLAKDLDQKAKIVPCKNKKQQLKQLRNGKIDIALGSFSPQTANYKLSTPIFYVENILFRRADGTKKSVQKLADHKVGMLKNGTQSSLLKELQLKRKRYSSISAMVTALQNKKIKAAILTGPEYTSYLQKHPEYTQAKDHTDQQQTQQVLKRIKDSQITAQEVSVATYHSKKLAKKINKDLKKMSKDGRLNKISLKYFGKDITQQ